MDNRAYSQFQDSNNGGPFNGAAANGHAISSSNDESEKALKKWKNSKRLCWAMLVLSSVTVILEIAACIVAGTYMLYTLLGECVACVLLAALGLVSSVLGLKAYRNVYESSKCWSVSHLVMNFVSAVAYLIIFCMSIAMIFTVKKIMHDFYQLEADMAEEELQEAVESSFTTVALQNATTTAVAPDNSVTTQSTTTTVQSTTQYDLSDIYATLRAVNGEMVISILALGVSLAFFTLGVIENVIVCRNWWKHPNRQKTLTIVYMPQEGNAQPHSVVVPAKTQVVVVPTVKPNAPASVQNGY